MKDVKFVQVQSQLSGYGFGKGIHSTFEGIEGVVRAHLEEGWEYCGFVPVETRGTGDIETLSLIFQKDK